MEPVYFCAVTKTVGEADVILSTAVAFWSIRIAGCVERLVLPVGIVAFRRSIDEDNQGGECDDGLVD